MGLEGVGVIVALLGVVANTWWNVYTWRQSRKPKGAKLTAYLSKTDRPKSVVIRNTGDEPATAIQFGTEAKNVRHSDPRLDGIELHPDETHRFPISMTIHADYPLMVLLQWNDSRGRHNRRMALMPGD